MGERNVRNFRRFLFGMSLDVPALFVFLRNRQKIYFDPFFLNKSKKKKKKKKKKFGQISSKICQRHLNTCKNVFSLL